MSDATPRPWRAGYGELVRIFRVGGNECICGLHRIGRYNKKPNGSALANAALIVRSVNSYDALVAGLRAIQQRANESGPEPLGERDTIYAMHGIATDALAKLDNPDG